MRTAGDYSGFSSMKQLLRSIATPPGWEASAVNTMIRPGLEPGPLDPECSVLTTRLWCLPLSKLTIKTVKKLDKNRKNRTVVESDKNCKPENINVSIL